MRRKLAHDEGEMEKQRQREKAGNAERRRRVGESQGCRDGRVGDCGKISSNFKRKSAPSWSSLHTFSMTV